MKEDPTSHQLEVEEISLADLQKLVREQQYKSKLQKLTDINLDHEDVEKPPEKIRLTKDEEWYVEDIVKKYGTDFKKGYKDFKLNKFVWNKN